jgi:tetratricopeptide (TPR) repeat protein
MNDYLRSRGEYERIFENAKRWAALYPEAAGAHLVLAEHYERVNDLESAIVQRKLLYEADPQRFEDLHAIGNLYEKSGNDDEALRYYRQYAESNPNNYDSYTTIGDFYRRRGKYGQSRDYYKKALLVDPERLSIRTNLAEIERHLGNFDASFEQCRDALRNAHTPGDSVTALWQLVEYHAFRGIAQKALEYQITALDQMKKTTTPVEVMIQRLFTLGTYVDAGRLDEAIAIARSIEAQPGMPFMKPLVSAGYIVMYAISDETSYLPEVEKHVALFEEWMKESGSQRLQWALDYSKSLEYAWRGEYDIALEHLKAGLEAITPDEVDTKVWMTTSAAQVARELEDYAEAERFLDQLFELEPFSPEGHLEAARIYQAQGQTDKAIKHLKIALEVWENADPDHPRAKQARELSKQLRLSS